MDEQQLEESIQAKGLTAPRITPAHINAMRDRVYYRLEQPQGTTSTFCHAYLDGAFYLTTGHSACVAPENFDAVIGQDIARKNAQAQVNDRLWELEGYRLFSQLNGEADFAYE